MNKIRFLTFVLLLGIGSAHATDYIELMRNMQDEYVKSRYLSNLWNNLATRAEHKNELVAACLYFIQNVKDKDLTLKYLSELWNDPVTREKHRDELVIGYLSFIQKAWDTDEKSKYLLILWNDLVTREKYRDELVAGYLSLIENTQNEYSKFKYLKILWNADHYDIETTAEINEFVAPCFKIFRHTQHEDNKLKYFFKFWKNKKIKAAYWDELVVFCLDIALHSQDEFNKMRCMLDLWFNSETREKYRDELVASHLAYFENTQDESMKVQAFEILWNDPVVREKHRDKLINILLDFEHNTLNNEIRNKIWCKLLSDPEIIAQNESIFIKSFHEHIAKHPDKMLLKLETYLLLGDSFQEDFNKFILGAWIVMDRKAKNNLCLGLTKFFGENNPRIQGLLLLLARDGNAHYDAISIYANLITKIKENYVHNASLLEVTLSEAQKLHFAVNTDIFSYLPASQNALASLEDVDAVLVGDVDNIVKELRDNQAFRNYFVAPFTEEGIMLQAMVQKFLKMGDEGKIRFTRLMSEMNECKQGKNQAIWDHYSVESQSLFLAALKNITDWLVRLQDVDHKYISDDDLLSSYKKSRNDLVALLTNMLGKDHVFGKHLRDLKTEDAYRLKALLGSIVNQENGIPIDNRALLGKTLHHALQILVELSNPDTFYKKLDELCKAHEIYPPANKFGDQLSSDSIDALIQKLKAIDVEGRGQVADLQNEMRVFVQSSEFQELINNYKRESGEKCRELVSGFVSNGWSIGLLNLMESMRGANLMEAVNALYDRVTIDKDMPLSSASLKKVILRALVDIKRQSVNAIAEKLTGQKYAHIPHNVAYIENLLGESIGLRNPAKAPNFDMHNLTHQSVSSKSLQEMLDLFHEDFTPHKIADHFNQMISEHKLGIIDPATGNNIIWLMLSLAAKEQLAGKGIDTSLVDMDELLYNEKGEATQLAMALFLTKLGILQEVY
ncbi:MAG: hypothetical protein Q8S31_00450 [Alphaproteobacteria bacterium]|nr:hypothetical protein [Alphaproteobacteria bacterium]